MSLWDSFLGAGKAVVGGIEDIAKGFVGGAAQAGTEIGAQQVAGTIAPTTAQGLEQTAQQAIAKTTGITGPQQASSDLLLKASKPVANVISKGINRPIATALLLTDPESPLYQADQYGKGFQPSDIIKAYNRTSKVSLGQALTKSTIFQDTPLGYLGDKILHDGGVDISKVNLWNDQDIKKNFVDNTVGRMFTGTADFVASNLAQAGITGLAGKGIGLAARAANLSTTVNTAEDLARYETLADSHIQSVASNGAIGTKSNFGATVQTLADTKDMNYIVDQLRPLSNNDQLPSLIQKTNNPLIVKDLILADKGYQPSLQRLMNNAPADLWQLGDMNSFIKGNVAASGKMPTYGADQIDSVLKAYDKSISEVASHQEIYDAFLDRTGAPTVQGTNYMPVDPKFGGGVIGSVRTRAAKIGSAIKTRSFDDLGGVSETVLGGGLNRPLTALLRFVGTMKPRGYVTYQGLRPFDAVDELNAVFDDIRIFKDGNQPITTGYKIVNGESVPVTVTAAEYRTNAINEFLNAKTPGAKDEVIRKLDEKLGYDLGRTYGFNDPGIIDSIIGDTRNILNNTHNSLARDGYAFDAQGRRLVVDAQTQRQLADSRPMLPWGKIERDLRAAQKNAQLTGLGAITEKTPGALHTAFEMANKGFSFAVLGRPAYVPKNSVVEPLLSSFLSMGHKYFEDSIGTSISNATKNMSNRIMTGATKIGLHNKFSNLNKVVDQKVNNLNEALHIRDNAVAEYENAFNTDNLSPATKAEHLATIKANLREAERLVDRIETDINAATKQRAMSDSIPSVYNLRRRIDFLKEQPKGAERYASEIRSAEIAVQKAVGNITTLAPEIAEHNKVIEDAWKLVDKTIKEKGLAEKEQAEAMQRLEGLKKRYYGSSEPHMVNVGGAPVPVNKLFDENYFGSAIKNEFSNADTVEQNFLNEARIGSKQGILNRKSPTGIVDVNNPVYFEELAYVINRQIKNDPIANMVFSGKTNDEIMKWAETQEAQAYLRQWGMEVPSDIKPIIQDKVDFVNRIIPDAAAQKYALKGNVDANGLKRLLGDKLDTLGPIHPTDIDYGSAATLGNVKLFGNSVLKLMNKAFSGMLQAENPYRWLWAEKQFPQAVERKLNLLHEQGVPVTAEQVNAVRQAAARETLKEAEKVFYTVRRQNRALYAARTVAAFPTASVNSMYRFGRLAVKYPGRSAGFMRNYYGLYNSFGVDKDGNPVDNPADAAYIVVPGTREMGINGGKGVRLSTKATGFLVNTPGPSWLATYAVNQILDQKPRNADIMRHVINNTVGNIPGMDFNNMFPSAGQQSGKLASFIPTWASDLHKWISGNDSNADYLNVHKMVTNYQMTMWEMKLGPKPTDKSITNQTRDFFLQRATWRFASPFGVAPQSDKPGQMFKDLGSALLKKYNGDFNKAQTEMLQILGPTFPADRYLYNGTTKQAYISPTLQAYDRIWKDNSGLTEKLAKLDPKTVGLLSSDINGDPDPIVSNFLANKDRTLPGGVKLNVDPMSAKDYETRIEVNRAWNAYRDQKQQLLTAMNKAGYKRIADNPDVKAAWDGWVTKLGLANPDWYTEYNKNAAGDNAYTYAQAFKNITSDSKFMAKNKNNDFFQQMKTFTNYRDQLVKLYSEAPKGSKTAINQAWVSYLQETTAGAWNPQLQQIIDRYFLNDNLGKATI